MQIEQKQNCFLMLYAQLIVYNKYSWLFSENPTHFRRGLAYELLEQFEKKLIAKLLNTRVVHADETGINIKGDNHWLHCVCSPQWTLYYAHEKRGLEAMESMALLTLFSGILVHDHWKSYFKISLSACFVQ